MFPAIKAAYNAVARVKALIRSLRVLNALQTHVPTGSDAVPKLTDLGLPAKAITDPFNGEPLHVKKTPQGWLVYSVGPNLKDDGGKVDDPNNGDVGVGPPPPIAKPGKKCPGRAPIGRSSRNPQRQPRNTRNTRKGKDRKSVRQENVRQENVRQENVRQENVRQENVRTSR